MSLSKTLFITLLLMLNKNRPISCASFVPTTKSIQQHRPNELVGRQSQTRVLASTTSNTTTPSSPVHLTIVIPAYNEQDRIQPTLLSYSAFLASSSIWSNQSSILVVDDGSNDTTTRLVQGMTQQLAVPLQCLTLPYNQGKGAALQAGLRRVRSTELILTADADGSADLSGLDPAYHQIQSLVLLSGGSIQSPAMVVGYRTYNQATPNTMRLLFRWGFRTVVRLLCGDLRVRDSQCGFKLMTASAAELLYTNLTLTGWSHDVEVLYRAREWRVPVAEQEITWQDKDGSKLVASGVIKVIGNMFWDVIRLRWEYTRRRGQ